MLIYKKTPLFLFSISIFTYLFFGCEKRGPDYSIPNANEMVQLFNKDKPDDWKGEYIKGPVEINIHKEDKGRTWIDFYLADDTSRLHFILQATDNNNIEETKLEQAEVIYVHRSMVINSLTSPYRVFATVDKEEKIFEPLKSIDNITYRPKAIGIIRQRGMNEIDFRAGLHCKCCTWVNGVMWGCDAIQGSGPTSGDCDAGGIDATSCSLTVLGIGSCNVSCATNGACCWEE